MDEMMADITDAINYNELDEIECYGEYVGVLEGKNKTYVYRDN